MRFISKPRCQTPRQIQACGLAPVLAIAFAITIAAAEPARSGNPVDDLPPHIRRLTWFGERADWSPDGQRLLFLSKTFGDVFELELASGALRCLTAGYPHHGYTRALYLTNGHILLSGPETFDAKKPGPSRMQCFLSVLDPAQRRAPVALNTKCSEGPAVSRSRLHIAWTHVSGQYPDRLPAGVSQIHEADIVYENGQPRLSSQRLVLDSRSLRFKCTLETQNFRPPAETELTFSAYGYQGTEVCAVDLRSGTVRNYSNAPEQYDEPEGIFPNGQHTLVECDRQNRKGWQFIDLWKLRLDGSGQLERLTHFSDYPGYKASNGVVSDDGHFLAFQMAKTTEEAGVGHGIFLYDFRRSPDQGRR
jgi:Tol biopolymer transport system component